MVNNAKPTSISTIMQNPHKSYQNIRALVENEIGKVVVYAYFENFNHIS